MKSIDIKRINYAFKKELERKRNIGLRFGLMLALVFAIPATVGAITEPDNVKEHLAVFAGSGSFAMCAMVSIGDVSDREVAGEAISFKVWLIDVDDIDESVPFPTVNINREVNTIPLLPGKYMHSFYAHTVPTFMSSGTKGDITIDSTNTFTIIMGGNRPELLNFIENYSGRKFILIFEECESGIYQGIGNRCKPVVFSQHENKNDKDGRYATFTFTQKSIQQPWTYIGAIIRQNPVTLAPDATALAIVAGNDRYIISDGTSAPASITSFTGISSADKGRTITLIGAGDTNPSTLADSSSFILVDGATWTASSGSMLHLRVQDANTLIEVGRV